MFIKNIKVKGLSKGARQLNTSSKLLTFKINLNSELVFNTIKGDLVLRKVRKI